MGECVCGGLISGSYKWNGICYEFYEPLSILCTNNESRGDTQQHFIQCLVKVKKTTAKTMCEQSCSTSDP